MRFLDTSIVIRYLTRDSEQKAQSCHALFQRIKLGKETVKATGAVIAECVYVLSSSKTKYHLPANEIRVRLTPLLTLRSLKLPDKRVYLRALELYSLFPTLDFADLINAAYMERDQIPEIYSYDRHFDRIPGIKRQEP